MRSGEAAVRTRVTAGSRKVMFGPVRDMLALANRNLIAIRRVPQLLIFSTIQPVIFVLLFRYVFGGAIRSVPGVPYVDFLMPGIFIQTVVFGGINTAIGMAADVKSGLLERFRSLPMSRSAVLAGRTTADLARNVFVGALMAAVGFLVGFRVHTGPVAFFAGIGLMLMFGYVISWIFATIGIAVGDPESAQAASFPVMAPMVFASTAFIPLETMPDWLQGWAEHQPVSVASDAVRALMLGGETASHVWAMVAWSAGILAVCMPLAIWRYRRAV